MFHAWTSTGTDTPAEAESCSSSPQPSTNQDRRRRKIKEAARSRRMLCGGVTMPWPDVLTICGLFAVQCIYGLYMMFLDGLLAAGVPSLFIIVVACAASSVVVLPFALALERCACAFSPWRD